MIWSPHSHTYYRTPDSTASVLLVGSTIKARPKQDDESHQEHQGARQGFECVRPLPQWCCFNDARLLSRESLQLSPEESEARESNACLILGCLWRFWRLRWILSSPAHRVTRANTKLRKLHLWWLLVRPDVCDILQRISVSNVRCASRYTAITFGLRHSQYLLSAMD